MTDQSVLRLDPAGSTIPAKQPKHDIALTPIQGPPMADARGGAAPCGHGPMADLIGDYNKDTTSKINRLGFRHDSQSTAGHDHKSQIRRQEYLSRFT